MTGPKEPLAYKIEALVFGAVLKSLYILNNIFAAGNTLVDVDFHVAAPTDTQAYLQQHPYRQIDIVVECCNLCNNVYVLLLCSHYICIVFTCFPLCIDVRWSFTCYLPVLLPKIPRLFNKVLVALYCASFFLLCTFRHVLNIRCSSSLLMMLRVYLAT